MDQRQLIRGCRKNDRKAQNELFDQYKALVMSISRRYGHDQFKVEEIFQESFIRIFHSLTKKNQSIKSLDKWIARVVINTNIDHYYQSRKNTFEEYPPVILDESHQLIIDNISTQQLLGIIREIPDGYRVIFNLYFIDGYKHSEIATLLKITESTSRSQLTRAKALLKSKLESLGIYRYEAS
jgi:RNA polymerase sigma-70 factor (ECF subfamily)